VCWVCIRAVCAGAGAYQPWLAWCILGCTCAYVFITLRVCFYNNACINSQQAPPLPWLAYIYQCTFSVSLSQISLSASSSSARKRARTRASSSAHEGEGEGYIYIFLSVGSCLYVESGGAIRWLRMCQVSGSRNPVRRTSPSTCRLLTLAGLGVSLGGFRAYICI